MCLAGVFWIPWPTLLALSLSLSLSDELFAEPHTGHLQQGARQWVDHGVSP